MQTLAFPGTICSTQLQITPETGPLIWSKACSPAWCQIPRERERERAERWPRLLLLPSSISFLHMGDWGVMNAPHAGQDSQVRLSGLCSCLLERLFIFYQSRRITQNMSVTTFRTHFSGDLQNVTRSVRHACSLWLPAGASFRGNTEVSVYIAVNHIIECL